MQSYKAMENMSREKQHAVCLMVRFKRAMFTGKDGQEDSTILERR